MVFLKKKVQRLSKSIWLLSRVHFKQMEVEKVSIKIFYEDIVSPHMKI